MAKVVKDVSYMRPRTIGFSSCVSPFLFNEQNYLPRILPTARRPMTSLSICLLETYARTLVLRLHIAEHRRYQSPAHSFSPRRTRNTSPYQKWRCRGTSLPAKSSCFEYMFSCSASLMYQQKGYTPFTIFWLRSARSVFVRLPRTSLPS